MASSVNSNSVVPFQKPHGLKALNPVYGNPRQQDMQGKGPAILQLPVDLLNLIGQYVATGKNAVEAARNAVKMGKVCTIFHAILHSAAVDKIIEVGTKSLTKWIQPANDPWTSILVDYQGKELARNRICCHV